MRLLAEQTIHIKGSELIYASVWSYWLLTCLLAKRESEIYIHIFCTFNHFKNSIVSSFENPHWTMEIRAAICMVWYGMVWYGYATALSRAYIHNKRGTAY